MNTIHFSSLKGKYVIILKTWWKDNHRFGLTMKVKLIIILRTCYPRVLFRFGLVFVLSSTLISSSTTFSTCLLVFDWQQSTIDGVLSFATTYWGSFRIWLRCLFQMVSSIILIRYFCWLMLSKITPFSYTGTRDMLQFSVVVFLCTIVCY